MRQLRAWITRLLALMGRGRDREFLQELETHIALDVDENVRAGMSHEEARRAAIIRLGGVEATREQYRDQRSFRWLESLGQDVRYAYRGLLRSPGFTLTAVLSLTIGIGVNTLVFSIVNALVLKPPAIVSPERFVFIDRSADTLIASPHSFPAYRDFIEQNRTLDGLLGYGLMTGSIDTGGGPSRLIGEQATGNYFSLLGVQPVLGRLFSEQDDTAAAPPVVVLSYDMWTAAFNRSPSAIGQTIKVNQQPATIIGVAPTAFHGLDVTMHPQIWMPSRIAAVPQLLANRNGRALYLVGRLKPGVSRAVASADLNAIATRLEQSYPASDAHYQLELGALGWLGKGYRNVVQRAALGVFALGVLVLLTACANLAMSLAARTVDRSREFAIRISLGSGRGRIVRLLVIETLIITTLGGLAAAAIVAVGTAMLSDWYLPMDSHFPTRVNVHPDSLVFLFATVSAVVGCLLSTIGPGRLLLRLDPNVALKGGADGFRVGRWSLRDLLAGLQVIVCCVLVTACVASLVSAWRTLTVPVGFDARGLWTMAPDFSLTTYTRDQRRDFTLRLVNTLTDQPGIEHVTYANKLPLTSPQPWGQVFVEGSVAVDPSTTQQQPMVAIYNVSGTYFQTLRMNIVAGRPIDSRDTTDGSPLAVVVNETFVRKFLSSDRAVGAGVAFNRDGPFMQVVGVVADGKYESLTEAPRAALFLGVQPKMSTFYPTIVVRTAGADGDVQAMMRRAGASIDPRVPIFDLGTARQLMDPTYFPSRITAIALTVFGGLAIVLVVNGVYSVVSYAVIKRRREIGLRVALGATAANVLRVVLGRTGVIVAGGLAAGIAIALALGRVLAQIVYMAEPNDPPVLIGVVVLMCVVAAVATVIPASRSLRIPAALALRNE